MKRSAGLLGGVAAVGLVMAFAQEGASPSGEGASPSSIDWSDLSPEAEFEIAQSAAPEHIGAHADIYVMSAEGFELARRGSNGFSCLVVRAGPVFAPMCLDPEGGRTTLREHLWTAEMAAQGLAPAVLSDSIRSAYDQGRLKAPGPGIAYMLSPDFVRVDPETGGVSTVFPPHLMFYAPYKTNDDIGALADHDDSRVYPYVLSPGTPGAVVIVVPNDSLSRGGETSP